MSYSSVVDVHEYARLHEKHMKTNFDETGEAEIERYFFLRDRLFYHLVMEMTDDTSFLTSLSFLAETLEKAEKAEAAEAK